MITPDDDDDDDDGYLRLQQGKGFNNLVYMSYVKHINPAKGISNEQKNSKHLCNNLIVNKTDLLYARAQSQHLCMVKARLTPV
jgi:hypothetical protein